MKFAHRNVNSAKIQNTVLLAVLASLLKESIIKKLGDAYNAVQNIFVRLAKTLKSNVPAALKDMS